MNSLYSEARHHPASRYGFDDLCALVEHDRQAVDHVIKDRLRSDVPLIGNLGHYITGSGGKRLRPLTLLLVARACGYAGTQHIDLAATIELIHTATLLHDDVVDEAGLRRGRETANAVWGNAASVLVGDFLYSRAFELLVQLQNLRILEVMARTTNAIAKGEVLQLMNCHDADTSEELYLEMIKRKTAILFSAAAQLGAIISSASPAQESALAAYGLHIGTAFQLIDDVLDYRGAVEETGKANGADLAEGKPTLPLIVAMRLGTAAEVATLRAALEQGARENLAAVSSILESSGAIAYTLTLAKKESLRARESLANLPESAYRDGLLSLADFCVSRSF